jgi:hypothetical protein
MLNLQVHCLPCSIPVCISGIPVYSFCYYGSPPPPSGAKAPSGPGPPHYRVFTITLRPTTFGRTPLDGRSTRRRDFYLITHNTHKRQTSMPPAGFEPIIPASERPQTHALDRAVTGIRMLFRLRLVKLASHFN